MFATVAAIFAACGSSVEENAASTVDAAQDKATEMMDQATEDAKAAAATVDSTAAAAVDTMKQAVENAANAATDAAKQVTH